MHTTPPTWAGQARLDDFVVEAGAADEHNEANNLKGVEGLPASTQRIQPYEQRAAGVNGGTRSTTQGLGDCGCRCEWCLGEVGGGTWAAVG